MRRPSTVLAGVALAVLTIGGCSSGDDGADDGGDDDAIEAVMWPAPSDPLERTVEAGLEPDVAEHLENHVHAHLDVFVDGEPVEVPGGIGINTDDPDVGTFPEEDGSTTFGGIERCRKPCISPLHTHTASGVIHTESETPEPNTLGEFFIEWGVRLDDTCVADYCSPDKEVAFYVDGEPYEEDPRGIELADQRVIVVVIGQAPSEIPTSADFSQE